MGDKELVSRIELQSGAHLQTIEQQDSSTTEKRDYSDEFDYGASAYDNGKSIR